MSSASAKAIHAATVPMGTAAERPRKGAIGQGGQAALQVSMSMQIRAAAQPRRRISRSWQGGNAASQASMMTQKMARRQRGLADVDQGAEVHPDFYGLHEQTCGY